MISFSVNHQHIDVDVDPSTPLLWVLRDNLGLTGTKYGCGMAQCGACTVHLNGEAIRSCVAHSMNVQRGPEGHGVTAEKCSTCHQDHNLAGAHMPPGAPNWGLPLPTTPMIWQGLTDGQICRAIKDPKQNKNRNLGQLVEHLTEDKLVAWGWNPGEGRDPIPMSRAEFAAKVKHWQAAGAPCPADN